MSNDSTKSVAADSDGRREQQLFPGDVLAGRFTVVRLIAHGGMGEVYEAADQYFQNRRYALKTLRGSIAGDPSLRQRFEREVLLAREVRHDGVCPTYDLFHVEGPRGPVTFLTMKLVPGESLAARLDRCGPMEVEAALPIVRQMAEALDAAHRAGVVHRDFKPGNVMLEPAGKGDRVMITDFGLSREREADETIAEPGQVPGTLGYIAPEVLHGEIATPASDIYSFGVTVYQMLTGRRPVFKPGHKSFRPPSFLNHDVPHAWDRMVMGCLEADPLRRFRTAGEAVDSLTKRGSSVRAVVNRAPRSRWPKVAAAAIAAAGLAALGWVARVPVYNLLHPLPERRFVALMAWPPDADQNRRVLLRSALDAAAAKLGRAEAKSKSLLIISPYDPSAQNAQGPGESVTAMGANLALTAQLRLSRNGYELSLDVIDAASGKVLRKSETAIPAAQLGTLTQRAASASAELLGVSPPACR